MSINTFLIIYFALGTLIFYSEVKSGRLGWDDIEVRINTLSMRGYMLIIVIITLMVLFLWVPSTIINLFKGGNK